jgi:rhodanese-related sulfurtransferase
VLDVREESEWAAGHIEGARYLGRGVLERDIEALVPELDRELVLYCGGGFRSALSADSLQQMGFRSVASLAGGWKAWRAAGGPVVIP